MPHLARPRQLGFDNREFFPVQIDAWTGPTTSSPTRPGLGVEVDEELLAKQEFKFWEAPHLRRKDGSVHQLVSTCRIAREG